MFPSTSTLVDASNESPPALGLADLRRTIVSGAAEMAAHMAWWLELVADLDEREGWADDGARSCAHWLAWRCGLDSRTARGHAQVARQLRQLPYLRGALADGKVSYSKVRAVCRVATADNDEFLTTLALDLTANQLERAVAGYAKAHSQPLSLADDEARRAKCGATSWVDADGLRHTELVCAPEDGALIEVALDYGREKLFKATKTPAPGAAGRLDALLWVLRRGLVNAERPGLEEDSRYLIMMHVTEGQALISDEGRVDIGNGLTVHPRTLQRLGCGGIYQAMLTGLDGRPLDLGRRSRVATPKQKAALRSIYPTCEWAGCDIDVKWCDFHHLDFWSEGGLTDLDCLRPFCKLHHRKVHHGGFRVVLDHRGQVVVIPPGQDTPLPQSPPLTTRVVGPDELVARNRATGAVPADDAAECLAGRWGGESLDRWGLGVVVDAMVASGPPPVAAGLSPAGAADAAAGGAPVPTDVDPRLVRGSPPSLN